MDTSKIKKVYVVFKTHLDVGFTDLAENVMNKYMNHHIPHSVKLAAEMNTETDKKFIWTLGSYMIDYYLNHADEESVKALEKSIERGDICWHGLACTSHTELQDEELLEFNLSISDELDKRFNRKTIAAKMTDVPGHTRALVKHLADHGIRYIHIGVNASSMVPNVPLTFVWKSGDKDVIVQYSFEYGAPCYAEGMDCVLEFAHTGDNLGPQNEEAVEAELERIQQRYPNAEIVAATMDDYAQRLLEYKDTLPVIEEEIADTWIHGVGSDPLKITRFRALLELKNKWKAEGRLTEETEGYHDFMMNLLMIPEHTWGLDFKKYLADFKNWTKKDFQAAREVDETTLDFITNRNANMMQVLEDDMQKYRNGKFTGSYKFFEYSHQEQMNYITNAVAALPSDLQKEAMAEFDRLENHPIDTLSTPVAVAPYETLEIGSWKVAFGGSGEIVYLAKDGKEWIRDGEFGKLIYSTYNAVDCVDNYYRYNREFYGNQCWSEGDFSKPGLEFVEDLEHRDYVFGAYEIKTCCNKVVINLRGNNKAVDEYGCPKNAAIEYVFGDTIRCCLHWSGKDANKMVEALWFDMKFDVENVNRWMMKKVGEMISPLDVAKGGNRRNHCVESMCYSGADGKISVKNIHSPMISVGGHWLFGDYRDLPDLNDGFSYCLFNNKWGTNFKMWCEDDCTFEYEIAIENN